MNCKEIINLLPAYQDKELSSSQERAVRLHLGNCMNCQNEERLLTETWNLLGGVESITPSPGFRDRLWKRIEEEKRGWNPFPSRVPRWIRIPTPTMAVIVGGLFLWGIGTIGGVALFKSELSASPSVTEQSVALFTSPVPQNSIEEIFLAPHSGLPNYH